MANKQITKSIEINKIDMRKLTQLLFIVLTTAFVSSCRYPKQLTYLQDLEANQNLYGLPNQVPEYKIRSFDNLYVNIQTLDPEVNVLFNPNQGNSYYSSTQQNYGGLTSQYINGYLVDAAGSITFPIIGEVPVVGLSLMEAQKRIKIRAMEYLKEPTVKLKILSFKFNVTGEVRNPGLYYNYQGKVNVLEAISMASGVTDYAKIKKVLVIRQDKFNTKNHIIDLTKKDLFESEAYYLQPDDLVYIPPAKSKNTLNNSTYSIMLSTISTISTILLTIFLTTE